MTTTADFLSEGAKSYIDALAAIEAFEGKVRGICREAYDKYKPQLVSKLGLKDTHCNDHDNNSPADRYAELGVWQSTESGHERLYVYVRWDDAKDGAPQMSACVMLEFPKKSDWNHYAELLRKIPSIKPGNDAGYSLWSRKNLSDLSSCAETFCNLLDEWLQWWPAGKKLN